MLSLFSCHPTKSSNLKKTVNADILSGITVTRTQGLDSDKVTFVFSTRENWRIFKLDSVNAIAKALPDTKIANDSIVQLSVKHANTRYYFKVVKNNLDSVIVAETVLPMKGQPNFRDLGGMVTMDGYRIKWGRLFRSGALDSLTKDDLEYMKSAGIEFDIDFRRVNEYKNGDVLPEGVKLLRFPISTPPSPNSIISWLNKKDAIALDTMFIPLYKSLVMDDSCKIQYRSFLNQLATTGKSTVYHCSAGKDRTGFATVLLLSALGVDRHTILSNYLETNQYISIAANSYIVGINKKYKDNRGELLRRSLTVNYQYIQTSLDLIDHMKGGMEMYLSEKLEITPELIQALKKEYLDNYPKK